MTSDVVVHDDSIIDTTKRTDETATANEHLNGFNEHLNGLYEDLNGFHKENDLKKGMFLVDHCFRIIEAAKPVWWAMENPANGRLKELIGPAKFVYQPWEFGSPWTKRTALWGESR